LELCQQVAHTFSTLNRRKHSIAIAPLSIAMLLLFAIALARKTTAFVAKQTMRDLTRTGRKVGSGLATVYGIVQQHNGIINVYCEPGHGTTFKVYLPACRAGVAETVVQENTTQPLGGHETLLLAEDDAGVRRLARMLLERAGYTVLTAENGAEAVEVFKAHCATIALIIADVVMPKLGGPDAVAQMREHHPGVPALFASGYNEQSIHTNFVLNDGVALIQKPYTRAALLDAVRTAIDASHAPGH